jgi:hypothetical protein
VRSVELHRADFVAVVARSDTIITTTTTTAAAAAAAAAIGAACV